MKITVIQRIEEDGKVFERQATASVPARLETRHVSLQPADEMVMLPSGAVGVSEALLRSLEQPFRRHQLTAVVSNDPLRVAECQIPRGGWRCSRGAGHAGPCAAYPMTL